MLRVVLDPNVLVSALISPTGPPRAITTAWAAGHFELIASPLLLGELCDVLARPKFRRWVTPAVAADFVEGLTDSALVLDVAAPAERLSPDRDDDYLIALARASAADYLVSGDRHLTGVADSTPPVLTPRQFLAHLTSGGDA